MSRKRKQPEPEQVKPACSLCGAPNEEIEKSYPYTSHKSKEDSVRCKAGDPKGLALCDGCRGGLKGGQYSAVIVQHEANALRLGLALGCHPEMKPLLKQHRIEMQGGSVALPPYMPRIAGNGLTFAAAMKLHKEAANERQRMADADAATAAMIAEMNERKAP